MGCQGLLGPAGQGGSRLLVRAAENTFGNYMILICQEIGFYLSENTFGNYVHDFYLSENITLICQKIILTNMCMIFICQKI